MRVCDTSNTRFDIRPFPSFAHRPFALFLCARNNHVAKQVFILTTFSVFYPTPLWLNYFRRDVP